MSNEEHAHITEEISKVNQELNGLRKMYGFHQEAVKVYDSLVALRDNPDFKALILEDYMKDFALSQVYSRADARLSPDARGNVENAIIGISAFNEYLSVTAAKGRASKDQVEAFSGNEQLLLSALAELHLELAKA